MRLIALLLVLTLSGCASPPRAENLSSSAQANETQVEATADASVEQAPMEEVDSTEDASEEESTTTPSPTASETKSSAPTRAPKPTATSKPDGSSPSSTQTEKPSGYTAQEVASKSSRTACWVIVSGGVYDLTDWISKHPGGSSAILGLCGTDATEAFEGKHGGEARPSSILDGYYLAPLTN